MKEKIDHSAEIIFNNALRIAVGHLVDIHPRIQNQLLADCMLDDMSDLNFDDHAVKIFMEMITGGKPTPTVGSLREEVAATFKVDTEYLVAKDWNRVNKLEELSELCSRGINLKHLNQLLIYIGGKSLNESYDTAIKTPPVYAKDSEHPTVMYSLGINYTTEDVSFCESSTEALKYRTPNILQLMAESRYMLEGELISLIECSDATQSDITINHIIIYMNDIETITFSYDMEVCDLYLSHLDMHSRLSEAKNIVGSDNFKEMLFSGKIFSSPEYHPLRQRLKGRVLEEALGM